MLVSRRETLLLIEPAFDPFLQGFGGAQATIGFGWVHQHQVAAVGDELEGGLKPVSQLTGAAIAERTALQQHQPFASGEGRGTGLLEGL